MDQANRLIIIATQLHALRQPLNVIALSCANIEARSHLIGTDLTEEYLNQKISRINRNISMISNMIDFLERHVKSDQKKINGVVKTENTATT